VNNIKVLFVIPANNMGGTNKALENMISLLNNKTKDINIEIFPMNFDGPFYKVFDKYIYKSENIFLAANKANFVKANIVKKLLMLVFFLFKVIVGRKAYSFLYKILARKFKSYDVVISFQEGAATEFTSYIKSNKKIAWVHCDYKKYLESIDFSEKKTYEKFDHIVCVSEYTKKSFTDVFESFSNKVVAIHNLINSELVAELSTKDIDFEIHSNIFNFISVGRLDKVKQFHCIPALASKLKKMNLNFKWYILGDGSERNLIQNEISKYNLEYEVILLGEKFNPYPYIKSSDLYICTSLSEACPNVINEAKVLGVPIISNDFGSVKEMMEDNTHGYIVNLSEIPNKIRCLLSDELEYNRLKCNLNDYSYMNDDIIVQLLMLLDFKCNQCV
jgi:glycosyltransferase involved in cell wall biosynthesis